jgi:hypothetical protein
MSARPAYSTRVRYFESLASCRVYLPVMLIATSSMSSGETSYAQKGNVISAHPQRHSSRTAI